MDHPSGSPEQTFQMMQCGNLDLNFPIKFGILQVGNTRVGKTTSAHYFTHQVLKGGYNDQKNVVYLLENTDRKYQNAKIGNKESVSETQIPNFFEFESNGQKIFLVDCPGYLDSFGCYRVINNRFFHYQVFSKVENIKFIITFTFNDMGKVAELMKKTFKQFLSGFKNINEIKDQLINATSVMITSVPKQMDLKSVRERFLGTPGLTGDHKAFYEELKKALIQNNRVFMFHNAELGVVCNTQNTILDEINSNTQFWKRNVNEKQEVDMSNIKISVNEYIEQDEGQFNQELKELANFYKDYIIKDINDLVEVLNLLVKDNLKTGDSAECIKKIIALSNDKKRWREKESKCNDLYKKYDEKRKKVEESLLKPTKGNISDSSIASSSQIPFWVIKLKVQKSIEELCEQNAEKQFINNQFSVLDDSQSAIKRILISLVELVKFRKEKEPNNTAKNEAALDFAYEIYKDIEISNKLYRLMKTTTEKNTFKYIEKGLNFILIEYPKILNSIFLKGIAKNSTQILIENLDHIKFDQNISANAANDVAKFLQAFKLTFDNDYCQKLDKKLMNDIKMKLDNQIIKLNNNAFESLKKQTNPSLSKLGEMEERRKIIIQKIRESKENAANNDRLKVENNRIIQMMAQCLSKNSRTELAFKLYDLLFDAHKVFQILDIREQNIRKDPKKQKQLVEHLISYMEYGRKYKRTQVALLKAQQAYHLAQESANIDRLVQISKFIKELTQRRKNDQDEEDLYLEYMFKEVCEVNLPKDLVDQVMKCAMLAPDKVEKKK